ncbi:MAG: transketolase family protein [Candidatus Glassbacteria bacterium]
MDLKHALEHTRHAYGETLAKLGERIQNIVVLDADLSSSTKTAIFAKKYPHRFFQMGIAEADMMDTAAGLAACGKIPFVSTFAIFGAGKGWEQIRNTVAQCKLPLRIVTTHGGISVGEDGSSHQALEDIGLMRVIPNLKVIVPADSVETRSVIEYLATHLDGPAYVRLTRPKVPVIHDESHTFTFARAELLLDGDDVTIIGCGQMVARALEAADILEGDGIYTRVLNMSTIKPIDCDSIKRAAIETGAIVTVEEHSIIGGLGSAVAEVLAENKPVPMRRVGCDDCFGVSGTPEELFERYGLTTPCIVEKVRSVVQQRIKKMNS